MTPEVRKKALSERLLAQFPTDIDRTKQETIEVALQAIELLFTHIASSNSRYKQLNELIKNIGTDKEAQVQLNTALKNIFLGPKFKLIDVKTKPMTLEVNADKNIKYNAFLVEKDLLDYMAQNQNISDEERVHHSRLQNLAENGQIIPQNAWLDGNDQREALEQLAQEHKGQDVEGLLRAVEVTSIKVDKEDPAGKTSLQLSLEKVKTLDEANLILNTGKHWVQVNITKNMGKAEVSITNSLMSDPRDIALQKQMLKELEAVYGKDNFVLKKTTFTANQVKKDGWSCGYSALAATAERLKVSGCPSGYLENNSAQSQSDFNTLRDWSFNLIIGQSSKDYHESLACDISLGTPEVDYSKPMSEPTIKWINANCSENATSSIHANNKVIKIENNDKSSILVRRKIVSATNTRSLDDSAKKALATKMIKIYIAGKMGLSGADPFPSKEEIAKAGIRSPVLKGGDKELKRLIKEELFTLSGLSPAAKGEPKRAAGPR